jgi:hypothetical protein
MDNVKIYLGDIGWIGVDWIKLVQDRCQLQDLVNRTTNYWVP